MSIKIISDSTCDLSKELIERYEISILPLHVILGEEEYKDGINITPEKIYSWSDEHKATPKTSAPAITDAMDLIRSCGADGSDMICFSISQQMSTSGNVMRMAAEELGMEDRVFVIDSANLSTGVGLLVIEAAVLAGQGLRAVEIAKRIESLKPYIRSKIIRDVYQYLESLHYFDEILITRAGGVISSHCGPGTLGILFIEEP